MIFDKNDRLYKIGNTSDGELKIYSTFQEEDNGIIFREGMWIPFYQYADMGTHDEFDIEFVSPHEAMDYSNTYNS